MRISNVNGPPIVGCELLSMDSISDLAGAARGSPNLATDRTSAASTTTSA